MYDIAQSAMQSSNFDATAFTSSIYGNAGSFDPGSFKVNHTSYTSDPCNDANNFYHSYINNASGYPQTMPGYGCREPPSYMEQPFFRHPSPSFVQNLNGGINYYKMGSNRQLDMSDYTASSLVSMNPALKQGDPFSYSTLQLESPFTSEHQNPISSGNLNSTTGPGVPTTEHSAPVRTDQNHFLDHSHLPNTQQNHQQSEPEEQKTSNSQTEPHQVTYHETHDSDSLFGNVKLEHSTRNLTSLSNYNRASFDSEVPSLSHQPYGSSNNPNCRDVKPDIPSKLNTITKSHSPLQHQQVETQQNTLSKHENFSVPLEPVSPQHFEDGLGRSLSSSSPSQANTDLSTKDNVSETSIPPNETSKTPGSQETADGKPTMSYIALIAKAILESDQRRLNLGSIYHWIEKHYPFYKNKGQGWRNSVRHNLSLNDCFIKAGRCEDGKGNYWAIHPANIQDFIRGDFRQRRRSRRRGRKKECDLGLYHVPNGYLQPPAPPLTSGMTLNPAALSSIYSPYTEAERRAYRLDEALLRQSMNNPFVKWYHQQQPGVATTPNYGMTPSPHHGCSAPGLYGQSPPMQWPHQAYATDSGTQSMYPALNSAFPR